MKTFTGVLAIVLFSGATAATAVECSGSFGRVYADPVEVRKIKGGITQYYVESTGASMGKTPVARQYSAWQHCNGLWTQPAEGNGYGSGHCYAVLEDGGTWTRSWKITAEGETYWENISGTGSGESFVGDKGTFETAQRFGGGLRIGDWKGVCIE
jgi:hypothetical protein